MAKFHLKEQAEKLRTQGHTIREIAAQLSLSRGTVSIWCRDIILLPEQILDIEKRHHLKAMKGRLCGVTANKSKKVESLRQAALFAENKIQPLNTYEKVLVLTALYWAEGSKGERGVFQFVNSDPVMIKLTAEVLMECFGVTKDRLACTIQINEMHRPRIKTVLDFWKNLLELPDEQFTNVSYVKTVHKKVYSNYDSYYGICRLLVRKSSYLKYQIQALIHRLKEINTPM